MRFVLIGLSIASSWGNGHATTYRGLIRELAARGHQVTFFEKRAPWYDANCDLPSADYCAIERYVQWPAPGAEDAVKRADVVVLGSYAADGVLLADWLPQHTKAALLYYDIDTPVTLQRFETDGQAEYLKPSQLSRFDVVLSFAGGPVLDALRQWGARRAEAFYCAVDPALYQPVPREERFRCALGYMGTYAADRQDAVEELFVTPTRQHPERRFLLVGPQYPEEVWPANVVRSFHVPPPEHSVFYSSCDWQLNLTRGAMKRYGWSPSVRLFEAAACGAPIISDRWDGFDTIFVPGQDALLAAESDDVRAALAMDAGERRRIGDAGRQRILAAHTYTHRVDQLGALLQDIGLGAAATAGMPTGASA